MTKTYTVIFSRFDNKPEEHYEYTDPQKACDHFELFFKDDSALYSKIVLLEKGSNTVIAVLVFNEDGTVKYYYRAAMKVKLRKEFASEGELNYTYMISNINDVTSRCEIICLNSNMVIPPIETVGFEMIEPVEQD